MNSEELAQIEVRFKRYVAVQAVSEEILFDVEPTVMDSIWGGLVFRLKADILSDDLPPESIQQGTFIHYQIPASTWQAFKERHAQAWWLRRLIAGRPVRYETGERGEWAVCTFNLERYRIYPESRLKASQHGRVIRMYTDSTDWTFEEGPQ